MTPFSYEFVTRAPCNFLDKLLVLYNNSWLHGRPSAQWKKAKVIPISKPGGNSYIPISLLQNMSKIVEKMIANRLSWLLLSHQSLWLCSGQSCTTKTGVTPRPPTILPASSPSLINPWSIKTSAVVTPPVPDLNLSTNFPELSSTTIGTGNSTPLTQPISQPDKNVTSAVAAIMAHMSHIWTLMTKVNQKSKSSCSNNSRTKRQSP
jgi:hypothetical protein